MMQSEALGLVLLIFSLCCLGTWPALLRFCSYDPHNNTQSSNEQQENPGYFLRSDSQGSHHSLYNNGVPLRNLSHVFMDYSTAYFAASSIPYVLALLLSHNDDPNVVPSSMPFLSVLVAMLGGSLLSYGNLSLQWATSIYGATLTTTLAIQGSLTVVLGTFLNYLLEPSKTQHPSMLGAGVVVFLIAICLASKSQMMYYRTQEKDGGASSSSPPADYASIDLSSPQGRTATTTTIIEIISRSMSGNHNQEDSDESESSSTSGGTSSSGGSSSSSSANSNCQLSMAGSIPSVRERLESQSRLARQRRRPLKGVLVAVSGGVAFGFFSPAFNVAVNDPFGWASQPQQQQQFGGGDDGAVEEKDGTIILDDSLAVARANLWFSLAFWLASLIGNVLLLHREERKQRVFGTNSIAEVLCVYMTKDALAERQVAFMAGIMCALGNALQFQGGKMVGYAAADLVQAYPLVSTLWDIFLFDEFANVQVCSALGGVLVAMYTAYLSGMALLACSSVV